MVESVSGELLKVQLLLLLYQICSILIIWYLYLAKIVGTK